MKNKLFAIILFLFLLPGISFAADNKMEKYVFTSGRLVEEAQTPLSGLNDITYGLIFSTDFDNYISSTIIDLTTNNADLTLVGATKAQGYGDGRALDFDGIDDYCVQKTYTSEDGTVRISTADGQAFLWDTTNDLSAYVGDGSDNKYMVAVYDDDDEVVWGFIGAAGAGETLGLNLTPYGTFTTWVGDNPTGWTTVEAGDATSNVTENPAGQCQLISDGTSANIKYEAILTAGKLYKCTIDIKTVTSGKIYIYTGTEGPEFSTTGSKSVYFTAGDTYFMLSRVDACDVTFDDVTVQEVTDPPATYGVKLYSSKTGSTQNTVVTDADFDPNDTLTYEVRSSAFQITDALTCAIWAKPDDGQPATGDYFISKYTVTDDYRSFALLVTDSGKIQVVLSSDGAWNTEAEISDAAVFANGAATTYTHVAFTYDGTSAIIYIDGEAVDSTTGAGGVPAALYDTSASFGIGAINIAGTPGGLYAGNLQAPRVYNRALSATEIRNLVLYQKQQLGITE